VVAFGLTNAPAAFQNVMNAVFRRCLGKHVLVYLDDIQVFSKFHEEHVEHMKTVLELLRQHDSVKQDINLTNLSCGVLVTL